MTAGVDVSFLLTTDSVDVVEIPRSGSHAPQLVLEVLAGATSASEANPTATATKTPTPTSTPSPTVPASPIAPEDTPTATATPTPRISVAVVTLNPGRKPAALKLVAL